MNKVITFVLVLLTGSAVQAETVLNSGADRVNLLELYTSEGCSSCPPADNFLRSLRSHPGLFREFVPVAFHVDYWDDLGWPDRFAEAAYSSRQRNHKREGNIASVYTPGFVYAGQEWRGFFRRQSLPELDTERPGNLRLSLSGDTARLDFEAPVELAAHIAVLGTATTEVRRGENRGRTLQHDFVVMSFETTILKDGIAQIDLNVPPEANTVVGWLTAPGSQVPLQVVGGPIPGQHRLR